MVGTSGSADTRCGAATASARTLPRRHLRDREREDVEHHGDVAGHQVLHRRRGAAIGHMRDVGAGDLLELLADDVARAAVALARHRSACRDWPWHSRSAARSDWAGTEGCTTRILGERATRITGLKSLAAS